MVLKEKGVTFIEMIMVLAILALLMIIMIMMINPTSLINRANDSRRKKDINRIKVSFEEYYNDKGCYPLQSTVDAFSCDQNQTLPGLTSWPCDPTGINYRFYVENTACPKSFSIMTNLKNLNDSEIPLGWYTPGVTFTFGDGTLTKNDVNFGVSSSNISWNQRMLAAHCVDGFGVCHRLSDQHTCQGIAGGQNTVQLDAYTDNECSDDCLVDCCYNGNICNQ